MYRRSIENKRLKLRVKYLEELLSEKESAVDNAKKYFLRNIYHEIRTPLNAIVGFSDLIEFNSINEKEKSTYVSYIRESSKDFLKKIDNIVEASILEAGLLKLNDDVCNLNDLLSEVYAFFSIQKHLADKKIAFLLKIPEENRDLKIKCDSAKLAQILTNLISNAFKFTEQGVIEFGYNIQDKNLKFFVKDSGIGGLKGFEDKVFGTFSKLDESDSSKEGLGLGLSLTKKLVELMKGKIWFESKKDEGSTFFFTVPLMKVSVQDMSKKETVISRDAVIFREPVKSSIAL
ncbi:MAG: HAMP domain-containing histidine kinase [Bacteroidales bacterium]|nr:HAMP domain-containing histidine kinase [Bacteroidales bacterium]